MGSASPRRRARGPSGRGRWCARPRVMRSPTVRPTAPAASASAGRFPAPRPRGTGRSGSARARRDAAAREQQEEPERHERVAEGASPRRSPSGSRREGRPCVPERGPQDPAAVEREGRQEVEDSQDQVDRGQIAEQGDEPREAPAASAAPVTPQATAAMASSSRVPRWRSRTPTSGARRLRSSSATPPNRNSVMPPTPARSAARRGNAPVRAGRGPRRGRASRRGRARGSRAVSPGTAWGK
jgi:hypothetical protein